MNAVASHALLEIRGLSKTFPGVKALDGVDFTLQAGEIHGLLGENGAGKSTLIKAVTGAQPASGGTIRLNGLPVAPRSTAAAQQAGIAAVYQEVNLLPNLTVAENLFLGRQPTRCGWVNGRRMNREAAALLRTFDIDIDVSRPLGEFSVAVQHLTAIARAVDLSARVLVLDEPTASLDVHEVAKLFAVMRRLSSRGIGIVFVTHFLDQVYAICDSITVLRNGRLVGERRIGDLPRLELISMMLGRELQSETCDSRGQGISGAPFIRFRSLGKNRYLQPFDLDIRSGEAIGIAGLLGSGRTETTRLVFGAERRDCGVVEIDGRAIRLASPRDAIAHGFGYCPEERKTEGIVGDLSIRENIILALQARRGWLRPLRLAEQSRIAQRFVDLLDIRTPDTDRPIGLLSGGNQQKALLARWLAIRPRMLILDEPTRGIDVGAHAEIMRLIRELCADGLAVLVASSELEEVTAYADRVVVLRDRAHVGMIEGEAITVSAIMRIIAADQHAPADAVAVAAS
ncbi:sugar ABC transporter ATP-binding protein [Ferrovibrio xuzhouensis]|uniref:Sugar ABC transporter ATP-binding protein n=1 Tax=Ferrovibrio xuzhouensis TaxID=1576914 RepID=A0ABV7VFF3_9PROT